MACTYDAHVAPSYLTNLRPLSKKYTGGSCCFAPNVEFTDQGSAITGSTRQHALNRTFFGGATWAEPSGLMAQPGRPS